ncbi:MAG: DUF4386 domain-containing protein [Candidatus Thorarchaeota archaeon]|jgi:hypothetical protein
MDSLRKTSIIVGLLFIVATASTLLSWFGFVSIYDANYLTVVAANEIPMIVGALLFMTLAASAVGISIAVYPLFRKYNESLALGYVAARIFEAIFVVFNVIYLVAILSLSKVYVDAAAPLVSYFETSGTLLLEAFDWSGILLDIPFFLSALLLNYMLYRTKLVPKWLSLWGFIGAIVYVGYVGSLLFLPFHLEIFAAPLGIQEMALAAWLIIKGFSSTNIEG